VRACCLAVLGDQMTQNSKKFEAVFAERMGSDLSLVTVEFHIEDEKDALEIAEDMALLEGSELIYLLQC
jgi:hypothetical protein